MSSFLKENNANEKERTKRKEERNSTGEKNKPIVTIVTDILFSRFYSISEKCQIDDDFG